MLFVSFTNRHADCCRDANIDGIGLRRQLLADDLAEYAVDFHARVDDVTGRCLHAVMISR